MIFYSKGNFVILEKCKVLFLQNSFAKGKNFKIYEGLKCIFFVFHFYPQKKMFLSLMIPLQFQNLSWVLLFFKRFDEFENISKSFDLVNAQHESCRS